MARPNFAEIEVALRELRQSYIEALPGIVAELVRTVERALRDPNAVDDARRLAHRLYGTAGSHTLKGISLAAKDLEVLLQDVLEGGAEYADFVARGPTMLASVRSEAEKLATAAAGDSEP